MNIYKIICQRFDICFASFLTIVAFEHILAELNKASKEQNEHSGRYMQVHDDFYYLFILFMLLYSSNVAYLRNYLALIEFIAGFANFLVDFSILHFNVKKIFQSTK